MMEKERFLVTKRALKFVALLALALPLALASCSGSDSDDEEDLGEDYDPEIRVICEHVAKAANQICDIYNVCESIEELAEHEEDIRGIRYVEDVRFSNTTMFVDIKDYGTIMYSFFPQMELEDYESEIREVRRFAATRADESSHPLLGLETAVVVNQLKRSEDAGLERDVVEATQDVLTSCGIVCTPDIDPSMFFFKSKMFEFDIVFLITHGVWDEDLNIHWLLTSDKPSAEEEQKLNASEVYKYMGHPRDEVRIHYAPEKHNNVKKNVCYLSVSEKYIESSQHEFKKKGKTIFFNVACQSLMGGNNNLKDNNEHNPSLVKILQKKGLGAYLGYDESNGVGAYAGLLFFGKLASGMSVEYAYYTIPDAFMHDSDYNYLWSLFPIKYTADLLCYYDKNSGFNQTRITGPFLIGINDNHDYFKPTVQLSASSPLYTELLEKYTSELEMYYKYNFKYDDFRYGFEYATKEDFSDAIKTTGMVVDTKGCTLSDNKVTFTQTLTSSQLTPSTTYHFRAYFYDGYDYYYSSSDSFTTKDIPVDTGTQLPDVPSSDF